MVTATKRKRKKELEVHYSDVNNRQLCDWDVIELLDEVEQLRAQLEFNERPLRNWLQQYPTFQNQFMRFLSVGGVTADDFDKFIKGKMRHRLTAQRKHLRMVVNNRRQTLTRHRTSWQEPGNDAA